MQSDSVRGPSPGRRWKRLGIGVALTIALGSSVVQVSPAGAAEGEVERVWGRDRYATSAALSRRVNPPGIPVVFVATGTVFPDGLVAAAAAGSTGGAMLLVKPNAVPSDIARELRRLEPESIVIAGGEAAVSPSVATTLTAFTDGPVERLGGRDRYETAALVSAATFGDGSDSVFITTGENFADTIGSVPAAVDREAPVLLTRRASIPPATRSELARLGPEHVYIVGGPAAIDASLDEPLATLTGAEVHRIAGFNRYATAAAISESMFSPGTSVVYLATGTNHPDGLGAAAAAAGGPNPVLLVGPGAVAGSVAAELRRLMPRSVVIVGGEHAVPPTVASEIEDIVRDAGSLRPPIVAGPFLEGAPNASTPLVRRVRIETSERTRVTAEITDGEHTWTLKPPGMATDHVVPIVGLRPGRTHHIDVAVTDAGGNRTDGEITLTAATEPLPSLFPRIETTIHDPSALEPGLTLFPAYRFGAFAFVVITDADGDVVWYHEPDPIVSDVRQLPNGNLLMVQNRYTVSEMNLLGNVVRRWYASNRSPAPPGSIPVPIDSIHHEVFPLANDRFLTLSSEVRSFDDYPTSETDPTPRPDPTSVAGDVIVEFDAAGNVVAEQSLIDLLDPFRMGYGTVENRFWYGHYPESVPVVDWSHGNAVVRDSRDGGTIVSLRHQDAIVKIGADRKVDWILGDHTGWGTDHRASLLTPTGSDFAWPYHPHAPEVTPSGTLMVFENGNYGAFPPNAPVPEPRSRAVEYRVDERNMRVEQVWEYAPPGFYTDFIGDADILPDTGNVLVTFGGFRGQADGDPSARIVEVSHDPDPAELWELRIEDTNPDGPAATYAYRAERIATLTP